LNTFIGTKQAARGKQIRKRTRGLSSTTRPGTMVPVNPSRNLSLGWLLALLLGLMMPQALFAPSVPLGQTGTREILIATDGQARLPIVISPNAPAETKALAEELAKYLKQISGADFQIKTGNDSEGIVLGTIQEFPNPALTSALEIHNTFDGREAYALRTEARRVLLLGATDLGASHATFRFLELLGCRWLFPAPEWEVIPSLKTLRLNANEIRRPAILSRRIWYGWGFFSDKGQSPARPSASQAYNDWARHNRMAGSFTINAGHAWENIIDQNKKSFEAHPEYFALVKDKRKGPQFCVSRPEVQAMAVAYALNYFKKRPKSDMVSMEPSDGGGMCECDDCKKLGSISERVFGLANHVAKAVAKDYPGKMVGLYAYNEHCEPPSFALEPNVYVQLTAGFITGRYSFEELLELWPKRCKSMGFYEYFSVWLWDFDKLPGGRAANVSYLQKQIKEYAAQHATSIDAESGDNWGPHGRGYYLANRLMWDPTANPEVILSDFYDKAFGPGATAMRRYCERLDSGNKPLLSRHLIALAFRDVEDAARLAKDRPDVQARLDQIKQYLRYIHLRWRLDREKENGKDLTLAAITHAYRTRYSFMNHWEAIRQAWLPKAAKDYKEPDWVSTEKSVRKPWAVNEPYTHEETEQLFQEGLQYFQPQQIVEKEFSTDLVPAQFEGSSPAASSQSYQGGLRYGVYSPNGEPIDLEVVTGTIAWYRDRADARYKLLNAKEEKLQEGRLGLDGKSHKLHFDVPKAGLYYFDFDDSSAGWQIKAGPEQPVSILLRRDKGFSHAGHMQQMYFYVPKGTRELDYFWSGGAHKLIGPDKKLVQEVKTSGEFVKVPVPEGMDGKVWSFSQLALGQLWFFNVPNQLAGSPGALLLPKEVVVKDGLRQR
jgi:hypothetical protein